MKAEKVLLNALLIAIIYIITQLEKEVEKHDRHEDH